MLAVGGETRPDQSGVPAVITWLNLGPWIFEPLDSIARAVVLELLRWSDRIAYYQLLSYISWFTQVVFSHRLLCVCVHVKGW